MNLDYNIFLELAVIPLDIIICVYLHLRFNKGSSVNRAFKLFALLVAVTNIVDVATAIVTSAKGAVPNWIHYVFNTSDCILAAAAATAFAFYVYSYVQGRSGISNVLFQLPFILDVLVLLSNPFTHLVFEYDEAGNYIHGPLFVAVAYGIPIFIFLMGCVYMLIHWKNYRRTQIVTMIVGMILTGTIFFLQMLFFDDYLITFFVASIGVLVIYLSLETPDYEKLIETMKELQEAREREAEASAREHLSEEVMLALSQAVDAKDHYTNGHSMRVAEYAREIARRAGKSEKECEDIFCMGLLHDVGKIGVHEDILNKKGKLSAEEFAAIKTHPLAGYNILKTIAEIPGLSTGARCHHERYDGGGYPDGLMGDEIPEAARIICVADCYDAMTSKRSYSTPKDQDEVREEFKRCSGTQFDPKFAEIMISIIDDDKDFRLREIS